MTDVREVTDDLPAERPGLGSDLREILAVDADLTLGDNVFDTNPGDVVNRQQEDGGTRRS